MIKKKKRIRCIVKKRIRCIVNPGNTKVASKDIKVTFEGAKVALPVLMDEYSKECDRKNVIENKINALLTIEIAILTVFVPMIPMESIKTYLFSNHNGVIIAATIACMLLSISMLMMVVSFGLLISSVSITTYEKVMIEKLDLEENLKQDANALEKGLCDHYKEITLRNSEKNDKKAKKYQQCIPITIISFFLLTLGTIVLKIL